jgi:hypothetical protein
MLTRVVMVYIKNERLQTTIRMINTTDLPELEEFFEDLAAI